MRVNIEFDSKCFQRHAEVRIGRKQVYQRGDAAYYAEAGNEVQQRIIERLMEGRSIIVTIDEKGRLKAKLAR
jgi:hypothetical protein